MCLWSRDKDGGHIIWSAIAKKTHAARNLHVLSSIEQELLPSEVYVVGIGITVVTLILT